MSASFAFGLLANGLVIALPFLQVFSKKKMYVPMPNAGYVSVTVFENQQLSFPLFSLHTTGFASNGNWPQLKAESQLSKHDP